MPHRMQFDAASLLKVRKPGVQPGFLTSLIFRSPLRFVAGSRIWDRRSVRERFTSINNFPRALRNSSADERMSDRFPALLYPR